MKAMSTEHRAQGAWVCLPACRSHSPSALVVGCLALLVMWVCVCVCVCVCACVVRVCVCVSVCVCVRVCVYSTRVSNGLALFFNIFQICNIDLFLCAFSVLCHRQTLAFCLWASSF